jgi:hypothetical protein
MTCAAAIPRVAAFLRLLVASHTRHALLVSLVALTSPLVSAPTAATPLLAATPVTRTREASSAECHVYVIALRVPHDRANARRLGVPGARSAASTTGRASPLTAGGRHHGVLQSAGDFSAGVSSALTFGLSDKLIGATGLGKYGSKCSGAFSVRKYATMAATLVGAGAAALGKAAVVEGAEAASAAEETLTLYHGSIDNFSTIAREGLDVARTPTWVTTELSAAENAIGSGRVLSAGQGADTGIVTSVVPRAAFEALQETGAISGLRTWPGFGEAKAFGEYVLRQADAVHLFNAGIR